MNLVHATLTTGRVMPDPNVDYWDIADVAEYWGVSSQTIHSYRSRKRNELPPPDATFGRSPAWKPKTIIDFHRPGPGARTDLK